MESWLWNPGCGILAGILAVGSWLWSPCYGILAVESWLWKRGCGNQAVQSWLWQPGCGLLAVKASGRHPGGIWEASEWLSGRLLGDVWAGLVGWAGQGRSGTKKWCHSRTECKSSFKMSILRCVFEGRCHQVSVFTMKSDHRQPRTGRQRNHSPF